MTARADPSRPRGRGNCPDHHNRTERGNHDEDSELIDDFTPVPPDAPRERLEELRAALRSQVISYGELAELQSLAAYIEPGDTELLEAAGVPEHPEPTER